MAAAHSLTRSSLPFVTPALRAALERANRLIVERAPPRVFVVSGPSGIGKDAAIQRLRESGFPIHYVVTLTTRERRPAEVSGVHYEFVSGAEFERLREADELLEWREVYGGGWYGSRKSMVREALARGEDVLLRIDVPGAAAMRRKIPNAVLIFMAPPHVDEQLRRLVARGTETPQQLRRRVEAMPEELGAICDFDYLVVNFPGKLDETVERLRAVVTAERCRVGASPVQL